MSKLDLHTTDSAPQASKELLVATEQQFGFVPNVMRQMAESPTSLGSLLYLLNALDTSALTPEEKWITLLVTSTQSCANYCVAANSTVANMLGVSQEVIDAVRDGQSLADPKLEALRVLANELVQQRGAASKETIQGFMDAGYKPAHLLDVIVGIGLETIASYTALAADTPVDEPFQANAWSQPSAA